MATSNASPTMTAQNTAGMSPAMQNQQTSTPNPMDATGSDDDTDNDFMSEIAGRMQALSIPQLNQLEQLLMAADPKLLQMIVTLFPEFAEALKSTIDQSGGGTTGAENAMQQQGSPSQFPGSPMPSAPTGLRAQFMQSQNSPVQ